MDDQWYFVFADTWKGVVTKVVEVHLRQQGMDHCRYEGIDEEQ